jgi:hypothetical protein
MREKRNTYRAFVGNQKAGGLCANVSIILKWIQNK